MATGQTILNILEVLHPELQLQAGENDVTKGLLALNMAQDYMESIFALQPELKGDTIGTVTTTAQTERTAFPTGLLRLDKLQFLDTVTSYPVYDLTDIREAGGHAISVWTPPLVSSASTIIGAPQAYFTDGRYIYWTPLPDGTYSVRWYGFQGASDITASATFAYDDICMSPVAAFAAKLIRIGFDDDVSNYQKLAQELFEPVINVLGGFQRQRAPGYQYRYRHNT